MDIVRLFLDYFGLDLLSESSTLFDFLNVYLQAFIGIFLVCFCIRSLILAFCDRR